MGARPRSSLTPRTKQTFGEFFGCARSPVYDESALNRPVTVAVVDREGNVLGVFRMTNAPANTLISGGGASGQGLEGLSVPSSLAAISKAGTAALFSTTGNAFTTRTASFIINRE